MKKYALLIYMLCLSSVLKAQTDTVAAKISKIPIVHVDVLAKFPGGDFTKYIAANIVYQRKSDRDMRGQVIISLKIDTNGKVSNINVLKSVTPQIDQEVVHVIKSSPKWQPAMAKGKPIGVYMVFNIDMGMISAMASVAKSTPAPVVTAPEAVIKKPVITATKIPPAPEKKAEPTPAIIEKKPVLKAVKKPAPPYDKKPVPVEKKPLPQLAKKKLPPPPAKKIEYLPAKKTPQSIVAKKIVSLPIKKAEPVVTKKPLPVVVKKMVEPIAKKTPPPLIAKKPAPAIAKKVMPALVKKAGPIVFKKTVAPIAKTIPPPPIVKKPKTTPAAKPTPQLAKVIMPPAVKKPVIAPVKPVEKKTVAAAPVAKHKKPLITKTLKKVDGPFNGLGPSSEALFPDGGKPGFFKYLSDNIHYPILSKINKIEGEVNLSFVIDKDGTVSDIKVIDAPAEDLAQEAKRVLLAAPKWKPAMQNGIPVKETFRVPVNFKIQDNKPSQQ